MGCNAGLAIATVRSARVVRAALVAHGVMVPMALALLALLPPLRDAVAQDTLRTLEIRRGEFTEARVPRTDVSGVVRAGLVSGRLVASLDPARLTIRIPEGVSGRLCVDLRSASGEYRARIERGLDGLTAGDYRVPLPTGEAEFFRNSSADELTVMAFAALNCDAAPQRILVASWSGDIGSDGFWVYVNSMRTRASIVIVDSGGTRREFPCETAPVDRPVLFDRRCRVDIPPGRVRSATIERVSGLSNRLPAVPLPVHW